MAQVQNWRTIPAATQGSGGRRRQTGGGGAGSGQEGANDGNRGREGERPGSLVVASVAGIARYTALSQTISRVPALFLVPRLTNLG